MCTLNIVRKGGDVSLSEIMQGRPLCYNEKCEHMKVNVYL